MKIKRNNIFKAFEIFSNTYIEFEKRIENKEKIKEMINTWVDVFEAIDFDYEYANEDFLEAVKIVISKNKYIPTIAEISDEMKKLYIKREESYEHELTYSEKDFTEEQYSRLRRGQMPREELIKILEEKDVR